MLYNAVIIGLGAIAPKHAQGIIDSGNSIVAVCDIDKTKADVFAQKYNCKAYTDYKQMLDQQSCDVVHICLPHYLHFEAVKYALGKNLRVFLEKPPAMTQAEFEALISLPENDKITVCFQNRFNSTTELAQSLIASGEYGALKGVMAVTSWCRTADYYLKSDWRGNLKTEGGGVLINQSIHALDMLTFLLGKPISFNSVMANLDHPETEVEDTVSAAINFKGVRATFFATNCNAKSPSTEYTLYFENATVKYDCKRLVVNQNGKDTELISVADSDSGKQCWGDSHSLLIKKFYNGIESGENPCTVDSCTNTMTLMFDMYKKYRGEL